MDVGKNPRISKVSPIGGFQVILTYETGEERLFDVSPYIDGSWFGELAEPAYFRQVKIEPEFRDFIVWPHGQDIAPHELLERSVPLKR